MTGRKTGTETATGDTPLDPSDAEKVLDLEEMALDWGALPAIATVNLSIRYIPMWDTRRQVISTFVAQPCLGGAFSMICGCRDILAAEATITPQLLDDAMLSQACADLDQLLQGGKRSLVSLPVHYETLAATPTRVEYLAKIRGLSADVRKHLIVELVGLPLGVPSVRLFDIAGGLRQACRAVIAQVDLRNPMLTALRDASITVAGIELGARPPDETQLINRLTGFSAAAQKAAMASYLHGIPSLSIAVSAVGAGFTYVSGRPVASPQDGLRMVERYGLQDLYYRMLRGDDT